MSTNSETNEESKQAIVENVKKTISFENFNPQELLTQAWALTNGNKLNINVLVLGTAAVVYILTVLLFAILPIGLIKEPGVFGNIILMLPFAVTAPLWGAVIMAGIYIARGDSNEVNFSLLNKYLPQIGPLFVVAILCGVLVAIGFYLLFLPGLFLGITLIFATPLLIDKKLQPVEALLLSLREASANFLQVTGLLIALSLINIVGAMPAGIGLIWTVPLTMIAFGLLYQKIFINGK